MECKPVDRKPALEGFCGTPGRRLREHGQSDAMIRERKFRNVQRFAFRGGCRQSRQHPHPAPAILRLLEQDAAPSHRKAVMLRAEHDWRARSFYRKPGRVLRAAEISDRADNAIGPRSADERAQIHQGRVVDAPRSGLAADQLACCHNASRPRLVSIGIWRSKRRASRRAMFASTIGTD